MGGSEVVGRWVGLVTSGGWVGLDRWGVGWAGSNRGGGSVGWCVRWPCDISLERVRRHLCHGMDLGSP